MTRNLSTLWRIVALTLLVLLMTRTTAAQTPTVIPPNRLDVIVIAATGDPLTLPAIGTIRSAPISTTSANCNLAPTPPCTGTCVNPINIEVDDPFRPAPPSPLARACRAPLPVGLSDGTYRSVSTFGADLCVIPPATTPTPCTSGRSNVSGPFAIVSSAQLSGAPTGHKVIP